MRHLIAAALVALLPATAIAQSLTLTNLKGPIAKASGKAEARSIKDLWAQINALPRAAAPTPAPSPSPTPTPAPVTDLPDPASIGAVWEKVAREGETITLTAPTNVRFGDGGRWVYAHGVSGKVYCHYTTLGDPAPGAFKECWVQVPGDASKPLPNAGGFKLGVNLTTPTYWTGEPTLANLLTGGTWNLIGAATADPVNGVTVPKGSTARLYLTPPPAVLVGKDTKILCTWEGTAEATLAGNGGMGARSSSSVAFTMTGFTDKTRGAGTWMDIFSTGSSGIHNIDCRVAGLSRDAVLSPEVVDSLKPFKVLRFLDWSNVNGNPENVTWDKRTQPGALVQSDAPLGVAIEHQVALAKATGAAPWFNVPWNADADYQRRMAQVVHDSLPADREVYVELSNEVWNNSFMVTHQARKEGLAAGLSADANEVVALRYAEKVRWMMPIWSQVFADRPGKLVRIAGSQVGAASVETLLGKGKLAGAVDAIAIAPYVGGNIMTTPFVSVAADIATMTTEVDTWLARQAADAKAVALKHGARIVMYEGGQHMAGQDVARVAAVNRAPGMADLYRLYIRTWKTQVDDVMMPYNSTGKISQYGAWGLKEYVGQPLDQAPKWKAALEAAAE